MMFTVIAFFASSCHPGQVFFLCLFSSKFAQLTQIHLSRRTKEAGKINKYLIENNLYLGVFEYIFTVDKWCYRNFLIIIIITIIIVSLAGVRGQSKDS